ncbi:MAG TPA: PH domain-containing protein [Croceibacterium sp.]|nr:PH domain-containing protein [Croceibacterium sp.]
MSDPDGVSPVLDAAPLRTDPRGFLVRALTQLFQGAIPAVAAIIGTGGLALPVIAGVLIFGGALSFGVAWLQWRRLTYLTGADDIRVEKGLLSRSARSVPYERIQDVSIEQKWLPRLLGLAEVRFETGAGGKEEIALAYLSLPESERLRELVRERKEGPPSPAAAMAEPSPSAARAGGDVLFAMDDRRVAMFGLFEFSLVVFAVLLGVTQQFDFLFPFNIWEGDGWRTLVSGGEAGIEGLAHMGRVTLALAVAGSLLAVVLLGIVTGIARTFMREYGFLLERTARGFRRRRGLFSKTDVLMPVHRVQAALVRSGLIRRRFGWYALDFISLAQDGDKAEDHVIAPFAQLEEIWPLVRAAGIEPPGEGLEWHRPSHRPWLYDTLLNALLFTAVGIGVGVALASPFPPALGALAIAGAAIVNFIGWRRHRHAIDNRQIFSRTGSLSPRLALAPLVKLQSAEIAQSPLGRWGGYATVRLGLAGGKLDLHGLPLAQAKAVRDAAVEKIVAVDFSRLPG